MYKNFRDLGSLLKITKDTPVQFQSYLFPGGCIGLAVQRKVKSNSFPVSLTKLLHKKSTENKV